MGHILGKDRQGHLLRQVYLGITVVSTNGEKSLQAVCRMTGQNTASFSPQTIEAPDEPGYQFLHARGLIVLDTKIGYVAVLPIDTSQASSIILTGKGEEISYFQFGGSDYVAVFQAAANIKINAKPGDPVQIGEPIGNAQLVDGANTEYQGCF